jgi:3-deoxy-manno-octulosonate cytidylyltransferase (CMP-KDO synthetase)
MHSFVAIIPARFASTRFPGKPLADIGGKPMIQWVYERAKTVLNDVLVATDDERIAKVVTTFRGDVIMTSEQHRSGTDRCAEALEKWERIRSTSYDVVINIQGDEPFIRSEQIEALMGCFTDDSVQIATLIKAIVNQEIIADPNRPKVVIDVSGKALYFSRSPIPYIRNITPENWQQAHTFYQHLGIYAYRSRVLREITKLLPSKLEQAESLEQLRWLENGYSIKTAITPFESIGIDTPDDLEKALKNGSFN